MKLRLSLLILLLTAGLAAGSFFYPVKKNSTVAPHATHSYPNTYDSPQQFFEGIYAADKNLEPPKDYPIGAVIVPHHLAASESIASGIKMLANQKFKKILLLSPDHFHHCPTLLCTVEANYQTVYGKVEPASDIVGKLKSSPLVTVDPRLFEKEHGIFAVLPFIKHYYPSVEVVPLAISQKIEWRSSGDEIVALLDSAIDDQTMLIVSSDFSHYLSLPDAELKDEQTAEALFSKDFDGIGRLDNSDNSDCPNCLWALAKLADKRGFYNPSVILHTNSATILNDPKIPETTSHFSMAWYKNFSLSPDDLAVGGDVTITRNKRVPILPEAIKAFWQGNGPRLVNLEGPLGDTCPHQENIFMFCNLTSLWLQLKGLATHWGIANNHMLDRGLAGVEATKKIIAENGEVAVGPEGREDENFRYFTLTSLMNPVPADQRIDLQAMADSVIRKLEESHDGKFNVVLVHGGDEYHSLATENQKKIWRRLIDAGADAVLVAHAHVPGDMEIYHGKPIFRGIGNFIFDQKDEFATSTAKLVRLRKAGSLIDFETFITTIR